jgi:hypothetical protein
VRYGAQVAASPSHPRRNPADTFAPPRVFSKLTLRIASFLLPPTLLVVAGCASGRVSADPSNASFSLSPGTGFIDTNCTGCNATSSKGASVEQFSATLSGGGTAPVVWSVSGGDTNSGAGSISSTGQYTPPSYLTGDHAQVVVTATLNASTAATAVVTVTPGFLQPLTPENAAMGVNGQVTVTGFLAEAGGEDGVSFALSNSPTGSSGGQGTLGSTTCQRSPSAFTSCTVTYSAPTAIASTGVTFVVATVGNSSSKATADLLLNSAGVSSNPASHQAQLLNPAQLGSSGGNNNDYDTRGNQVADCCGGTLGSLVQDSNGHQYLLSNNHVLARSDQAAIGDSIIQPGLIDNNCVPYGDGPGTTPVASLTGWLALSSSATNADAAIAQVSAGAVDATGSILEMGTRLADGTLGSAPPGISSTNGKGETVGLGMTVSKSGRTTGLTCAAVSAINLDVNVDYFTDCAETKPYLTKTYTNQLAITGNQFSDAGDSGSLVVDSANAEPVGLFFAGGTDAAGVSEGVANPAPEVLAELSAQVGSNASYSFVGTTDHAVSCLNYGDSTVALAQSRALSDAEMVRSQMALGQARLLVNPTTGILGVATGKSSDHPGEGAILVYVDENASPTVPATVDGVRTLVIPTNARAVALGSAPQTPFDGNPPSAQAMTAAALNSAIAVKKRNAHNLMLQTPAFFGVGVGQSLDNPKEAALVIYVDRKKNPGQLPGTIDGLRTRYVLMDRLHVTRSYAMPIQSNPHCMPHSAASHSNAFDLQTLSGPKPLNLN